MREKEKNETRFRRLIADYFSCGNAIDSQESVGDFFFGFNFFFLPFGSRKFAEKTRTKRKPTTGRERNGASTGGRSSFVSLSLSHRLVRGCWFDTIVMMISRPRTAAVTSISTGRPAGSWLPPTPPPSSGGRRQISPGKSKWKKNVTESIPPNREKASRPALQRREIPTKTKQNKRSTPSFYTHSEEAYKQETFMYVHVYQRVCVCVCVCV